MAHRIRSIEAKFYVCDFRFVVSQKLYRPDLQITGHKNKKDPSLPITKSKTYRIRIKIGLLPNNLTRFVVY